VYEHPVRNWYVAISPMYSVWIIATLFLLPVEKFSYWILVKINRRMKRRYCVIQKDYENLFSRKEFDFTHTMPYLLGLLTIVMYFVGGMPFLVLIFALYALAYFWIEKLLVLKFYKKPKNLDEIAMRFADYILLGIFVMHLFSSIVMFGTADVFPQDTEIVEGLRKGFTTNYYVPVDVSLMAKFGIVTNMPHLALILLMVVFVIFALVFRNKVTCRKFKYFPMSFSSKYKYIPGTFNRVKNNCVIGEVTYNIADLEKYREALAGLDMSKINEDGFKAGYSNLFQNSNGPAETSGKMNNIDLHDKSHMTQMNHTSNRMMPPLVDPQKVTEYLQDKDLTVRNKAKNPKDPKVQVVGKDGKIYQRRKTFVQNWEFEDPNEEAKEPEQLDG
jgi:hypothetical protein